MRRALREYERLYISDFGDRFNVDNPRTARYELDLLQNLKAQGKVGCIFVITPNFNERIPRVADDYIELLPAADALDDQYRAPCDVIAAQLLGLYLSLSHGLRTDNPCSDGTISRVVEGVTVYE